MTTNMKEKLIFVAFWDNPDFTTTELETETS